jgi:hypothetical protein
VDLTDEQRTALFSRFGDILEEAEMFDIDDLADLLLKAVEES